MQASKPTSEIIRSTHLLQNDKHSVEQLVILGEMEDPHPVVQQSAIEAMIGITKQVIRAHSILRKRVRERLHTQRSNHEEMFAGCPGHTHKHGNRQQQQEAIV